MPCCDFNRVRRSLMREHKSASKSVGKQHNWKSSSSSPSPLPSPNPFAVSLTSPSPSPSPPLRSPSATTALSLAYRPATGSHLNEQGNSKTRQQHMRAHYPTLLHTQSAPRNPFPLTRTRTCDVSCALQRREALSNSVVVQVAHDHICNVAGGDLRQDVVQVLRQDAEHKRHGRLRSQCQCQC
jgi:hypothetical protein